MDGLCLVPGVKPNKTSGYVILSRWLDGKHVGIYAHRQAWVHGHGPIPAGFDVHHKCGNEACWNLRHLEALSKAAHARAHGALVTHCPRGHEYTPENTRYLVSHGGRWRARGCRTCHRERERARTARRRAGAR